MAADDDLDALEAQLEDYDDDDDEDDDDLPPLKRIWKKYKLVIVPAAAFVIFIPVILMSIGGSDDGQPKLVIVPELAPDPGRQIKMTPEQPGGGKVPGQEEGVFSVVTEGKNEGKIVITAPPENPEMPVGDGKAADGAKAAIAMAPEGAEKTPTDGAMIPPTPPGADAEAAALPPPPAPGEKMVTENILPAPSEDGKPAADGGKVAENPMPAPAVDGKTADTKLPAKPADVAVQVPAESTAPATPAKVPANNNQIAVVIPKVRETTMTKAPPPGNTKFTPMRTMAGVYRIQVASARSESGAKTLWKKQVNKHPDVLGQLPLTVQTALIKDRGTFYRVQGGAFGDREAADTVCRTLKSRGQDCIVVRP